jgi:hypothetical protein
MSPFRFSHVVTVISIFAACALGACNYKDSGQDFVAACDKIASHPHDPRRQLAGVPDDQVPLGAAIEACGRATKEHPKSARSWFQLGRSYWLARRDKEAFAAFIEAADQGYPAAMKFIGDAYLEGRGLPKDQQQDANTALKWYKMASDGGFEDGQTAIEELKKNQFNPNLFKRPEFITMMYEGRFSRLDAPISFLIYVTGFNEELGSERVSFIDQSCTPLSTLGGTLALQGSSLLAAVRSFKNKKVMDQTISALLISPLLTDEGHRDAFTLINNYGCKSRIAKTILDHTNLSYEAIRNFLNSISPADNPQ